MKRQFRRRRSGFTLMEILLVLAILVILGSLVGVGYVKLKKNADMDAARTQIRMLEDAVNQYRLDVGKFPTEGLDALQNMPPDAPQGKWRGPYLQKSLPLDPWGNAYVYQQTQDQVGDPSFEIMSNGPDGANGTNDDIRLPR